MRPKLHTLDHVHTILGRTEPVAAYSFHVGDQVRFQVDPGYLHGLAAKAGADPVDALMVIGTGAAATEFRLTKDTLLEAANLTGFRRQFAAESPADLLEGHLNHWFRRGLVARTGTKDFQLLVAGETGAAITRAATIPFSNLRLLDQAVAGIHAQYGPDTEILADYKLTHSLKRTHVRLIVPAHQRTIERSGTTDDTWSVGVQFRNSLTGSDKTSIDGYLFRWWCTNGAINTAATSGVWSRRGNATSGDVYEWARIAVDDILGGLEPALDQVQSMVDIPIEGHANEVLRDVFETYHVPVPERTRIIENMVEAGSLTMYSVMQAITAVANNSDLDPAHVENLMRLGGDLPRAAHSRCDSCLRLMPH